MELYMGTIFPWPINFEPAECVYCAGQKLTVAENMAMYSLIGITYGGDDNGTYFNLPDLRGRVIVGANMVPQDKGTPAPPLPSGITPYALGNIGGYEQITLKVSEMPSHVHMASSLFSGSTKVSLPTFSASGSLPATKQYGDTDEPGPNSFPAKAPNLSGAGISDNFLYGATDGTKIPVEVTVTPSSSEATVSFTNAPVNVAIIKAGADRAHENRQPFIAMNYLIVMYGYYPPRQ